MNLADVVAAIDAFDDALVIHARMPWTAESDAHVGRRPAAGLEVFCPVREAKEKLLLYVGDPAAMRLARVVAYADVLRARRRIAEEDTRTFWYRGQPVGTLERGVLPLRAGRHRYMSNRCRGHHLMLAALRRNAAVRCALPGGVEFQVVAIPEPGVIEVGEVAQ